MRIGGEKASPYCSNEAIATPPSMNACVAARLCPSFGSPFVQPPMQHEQLAAAWGHGLYFRTIVGALCQLPPHSSNPTPRERCVLTSISRTFDEVRNASDDAPMMAV